MKDKVEIPDVMIEELHYIDGKIDMRASHPIFSVLMDEISRMMYLHKGTNFLTFTGKDQEGTVFSITVQKVGGKTPEQEINRLKGEIERAESIVDILDNLVPEAVEKAKAAIREDRVYKDLEEYGPETAGDK